MRGSLFLLTLVRCGLVAGLAGSAAAHAQEARVAVARENFRAAPAGTQLATVIEDAPLRLGSRDGRWRQATLEGWVWAASVRPRRRGRFDLVVAARGGENLRATPNGRIIAELRTGMLLERVEQGGAWIRVRRAGWIWEPSIALAAAAAAPAGMGAPPAESPDPPLPQAADSTAGWSRIGPAGAPLLGGPGGDTLARIRPQATVEIRGREGNWARVRLEGWVWQPALAAAADTGAVLKDLAPAALLGNPDGFRGRIIEWSVQFISLERAEKIRTDFHEGEHFILARAPGSDGGFVYIAVPDDRLDRVRRIPPLHTIRILARVRTGRSPLMDAPVLDLLEVS